MTISFENSNGVIVYAFEQIISFARDNQYIFVTQWIWWMASIIRLQQGFIIYIDTLDKWLNIGIRGSDTSSVYS